MSVATLLNHPMHLKLSWFSLDVPQVSLAIPCSPPPSPIRSSQSKTTEEKENVFAAPAHGEKVWGANYRLMHQSHQ